MKRRLAGALLLVSTIAAGQDLSQFERILYPVVTGPNGIDGANGSHFSTSNLIFAAEPVRVFPLYQQPDGNRDVPTVGTLTTGITNPVFCCPPSRLGRVLFVDDGSAVTTSSTLIASDAGGNTSLTSLPVVRERDFRSATAIIPGVISSYTYSPEPFCRTATALYRHRLRIYDPDATGHAEVRVRTFHDSVVLGPEPIFEAIVKLDQREGSDPSYPAFAELTIDEICNSFSCHTPCWGGRQRIEIEPLTPGMRFWAFVSGTNNTTQQVVVNYPQ